MICRNNLSPKPPSLLTTCAWLPSALAMLSNIWRTAFRPLLRSSSWSPSFARSAESQSNTSSQ
ncbi:unnamed protein product [Ectocarpus sp. CCAP 1310/34]|nr:unnamed protein product [Ectocarpus sp. CCAP 1310/34]